MEERINDIILFLQKIFKGYIGSGLFLEIRPLPSNKSKGTLKKIKPIGGISLQVGLRYLFPLTEDGIKYATEFSLKVNEHGYHAYYGVLPRDEEGEVYTDDIQVLYQDIDYHDTGKVDINDLKNRILRCDQYHGVTPSIVVNTGMGFHVYYLTEPIDLKTWKACQKVLCSCLNADDKVAGDVKRILRLPFTINWKYNTQSYIVSEQDIIVGKETLQKIASKYKEVKSEHVVVDRVLTDKEIQEIVEAVKPFYRRGHRHNIVNFLTAFLYKNGIAENSVYKVVELLAENDEEKEKRIDFVSWFYEKGKPAEEVKGVTGLEEEFEIIKEKYSVEKDILDTLSVLQSVVGRKTVGKDSLIVFTEFYKKPRGYINSRRRKGIYSFVKDEDSIKIEREIIRACIDSVKIIRNPYTHTTFFELSLTTKAKRNMELAGTFKEILNKLESEALITHRKADLALSSILSIYEETKNAEVIEDIQVSGFYMTKEGEIIANCELPEHDKSSVNEALCVLHEFIDRWFKDDPKAVTVVKWCLLAPFFFVRKQMELNPWKWIFLLGTSGTGKSTLLQLAGYFYGINIGLMEISAGAIGTEARLGKKLSQWTFPFIVNEAKAIFTGNESLRELLKNAWDRITFRGKYKEGVFIEELSLAPLAFTSNEHIEFSQAEYRRIDVFQFSWKNRIKEEQRKEFEKWKKNLRILNYIGRAVFEIIRSNIDILSYGSYIDAGEEILKTLYYTYSGTIPEWCFLKPEDEDFYIAEKNFEDEIYDDLIRLIYLYVIDKLREYTGNVYAYKDGQVSYEFKDRIMYIQGKNIPSAVMYDSETDQIYITKEFLEYLNNRKYTKVGTLKEIAEILKGKYTSVTKRKLFLIAKKVAVIPCSLFNNIKDEENNGEGTDFVDI